MMYSDRQPRQLSSSRQISRAKTPDQQIVGQQLLQLTPDEIGEIQRKLQQGEIIHGLNTLPQGINPTHKFLVKIRKPVVQKVVEHQYVPQQSYSPINVKESQECSQCPYKDQLIRTLQQKISNLENENQRLRSQVNDHQMMIQQINNQRKQSEDDLQLQAIPNQNEEQIEQLEYKNRMLENQLKSVQQQHDEELQQLQNTLKSNTRLNKSVYEDQIRILRDQLQQKIQEVDLLHRQEQQVEIRTIYKADPDIQLQLEQLQSKYRSLESQHRSLQNQYDDRVDQLQIQLKQYQMESRKYQDVETYLMDIETLKEKLRKKSYEVDMLNQQLIETKTRETRVEQKIIYKADPDVQLELDQLRQKYKILEQQLISMKEQYSIQLETYQTRIYQFESRKSDSDKYLIEIDQLKDQLRRKNADLEQFQSKIYILEKQSKNDEQIFRLKTQYEDLQLQYELECQQTKKLKQQLEDIKSQYSRLEISISQKNDYRIKELEQLLSGKDDRIRQLQMELQDIRSSYEVEINQYKTKIQQISINMDSRRELEELKDQINMWKLKYDQADSRYKSLQQSYETIQITMTELKNNDSSEILKLEVKRLQKIIVELRSEIDRLQVKDADNQWLSRRYEEQQHLVEQYKSQLGNKSSVKNEYTYEIQTSKARTSDTNKRDINNIITQLTTNEPERRSFNYAEATVTNIARDSSYGRTFKEPQIQVVKESVTRRSGPIQQGTNGFTEYVQVRESTNSNNNNQQSYRQQQGYATTMVTNTQTQQYSQRGVNYLSTDNQTDQLRKSRALEDSRAMKWCENDNEVIEEVLHQEKRFI